MKNRIVIISVIAFISLMVGCDNAEQKRIERYPLPVRPLTVIEITPVKYANIEHAYRYKLVDQNGYVFYITEKSLHNEQPKRMVGDVID